MTGIAWSRRAADELWSGVVTPLTFSLLSDVMADRMVRRRLRRAGFEELSDAPVFRLIRGRVYVNAILIADVLREVPAVFLSDGVLGLIPEALRSSVRATPRSLFDRQTARTIWALVRNEAQWTPLARIRAFEEACADVRAAHEGASSKRAESPEAIRSELDATRDRLGDYLETVSWTMIYAYVFSHLAAHVSEAWLDEPSFAWTSDGVDGVRTFEVHAEISSIADQLAMDARLRSLVSDRPATEVAEAALRGEIGPVGDQIRDVSERHGHRLIARDLSFPTWGERPEFVVEMVKRLVAARGSKAEVSGLEEPSRSPRRRGVGWRARLLEVGLAWCRPYYAARENMRYHADYFLSDLRRLALAAGGWMTWQGVLRANDDVFYLTFEELRMALQGDGGDLRRQVEDRRRSYETFRAEVGGEVFWGDDEAPADVRTEEEADATQGVGASPGRIEARVRVLHAVEELDAIEEGEILIASATDPTWASYLSLTAGLVLEVGGLLSHGAIVARELGIPAVVDVAGATKIFQTGDRLRIDGATGVVERI